MSLEVVFQLTCNFPPQAPTIAGNIISTDMNLIVASKRHSVVVSVNKQPDTSHISPVSGGVLPENAPYKTTGFYHSLTAVIHSDFVVEADAAGGATGVAGDGSHDCVCEAEKSLL